MTTGPQARATLRVGVDLGGTKIAGVALGAGGHPLAEHRMPAPRGDYAATVRAIGDMVRALEEVAGGQGSIGIGIPGSEVQQTSEGPVAVGGKCIYWLHTHAPDGVIHIESPFERVYTLGNLFDIWHQPLSKRQVGDAKGDEEDQP